MDQFWNNYCISGYSQYAPPGDGSHNFNVVNNCWNFKPKAYVNPKLVNSLYPFMNFNSGTISKKIHVNPKFKYAYYQNTSAQPIKETNSFHINPHFYPLKINVNTTAVQGVENFPVSTSSLVEEQNNRESTYVSEEKVDLTERQSSPCYPLGKIQSFTNGSNSNYYWSKQTALPSSENVLVLQKEFGGKSYPKSKTTKYVPSYSSGIKTRHKIVKGLNSTSNIHKVNKISNCKVQQQNPYKIVNTEKLRLYNSQRSKINCTPKESNMPEYLESNVINTDKKESGLSLEKLNAAAKMRASNINHTAYVNKITNLIRTKYMSLNKRKQLKLLNIRKYKLDKRKKNLVMKRNTCVKGACVGSTLFSKRRCGLKDKTWKSSFYKVNKYKPVNGLVWRKEESLKKDLQRTGKSYPNKTVVNIGGIMYKSTVNKLTRTKHKKQSSHQINTKPIFRSHKINQIVYVRGEKFLLGEGGKTLIRQIKSGESDKNRKFSVRRVDIGGVTYIQKSNNILIQTKTHQARQFVNYAKQKSIALLSNLRKRNNKPCMIYQKFGICRRHSRGMCIYIHDPKNIALCKKFLKGDCDGSGCLLSHNVVKEKVATCHFFLKGNCHRENCPFLHVKVNKKAGVCMDFVHGFCSLGQNCKKRHIHQCPDFEKKSCSRGIKCPYPHVKNTKKKTDNGKTYKVSKFKLTGNPDDKGGDKNSEGKSKKRGKKKTKTRKRKIKSDESSLQESGNDSTIECIPKRVKLDNLPLFIPLNT